MALRRVCVESGSGRSNGSTPIRRSKSPRSGLESAYSSSSLRQSDSTWIGRAGNSGVMPMMNRSPSAVTS